jgi:uncharacterized NAD(P)/FAD-binding protein YdhS
MADREPRIIAIVGAGFSGTATAIQLLRQKSGGVRRVVLIERGPEFGRGLAYARSARPFLLNVPASRMSATLSDPDEFLRFAQRREPSTTGEDFLPRTLYGDYLQGLLEAEAIKAPAGVQLDSLRGEVVDASVTENDELVLLTLADGRPMRAHNVVLALGTPLPRLPAGIHCTAAWPQLRKDPWAPGRALDDGGPLLIIGSGLTMVDVVSEAVDRIPGAMIHAISRHGLVPPIQTAFRPDALQDDGGVLAQSAGSTRRLVAAARRLAREAERRGGDWREVVTLVRRQAPGLWCSLSNRERARFLRHARVYWDIHRHRAPDSVLSRLNALRLSGQLSVHAGRLVSLEGFGDGVRATWLPRGSNQPRVLEAAEVVDCTGPDYNVMRSPDPLWQALLARGLAIPDELRLGIQTGPWGALICGDGSRSRCLFYVGPFLRAAHWEATAVGELRIHAEQLARHLIERT